jgi:hypothetical protein
VGQEHLAHGRATSGKVLFEIPAKGTRRSKSLEVLIPILCLKGMSTGDLLTNMKFVLALQEAGARPPPVMPEDILRRADALERAKALAARMPGGWPNPPVAWTPAS